MKKHTSIVRAQKVLRRSSKSDDGLLEAARLLLLYAVLFKYQLIRIWPHVYAGEFYAPSRFVYYSEFLVTVMSFAIACVHIRTIVGVVCRFPLIFSFVFISIVFGIYNIDRGAGLFFYGLGYVEICIAVLVVVSVDGPQKVITIVANSGTVFLILNVLSLALPSVSFMISEFSGVFRGLTPHRNDLSHISAIILLFSFFAGRSISGVQRILNICLAILMIALAKSVQGIVLSLACGFLFLIFHCSLSVRRSVILATSALACTILLFVFTMPNEVEALFSFFGRDTTFTGRDRIWSLAIYLISVMPFYGYGLGSISSEHLSTSLLKEYGLGTLFGSAHNAYLEAFLAYGWLGGTIFALIVFRATCLMMRVLLTSRRRVKYFSGVLLFFSIFGGVTASEKLFLPNFGWLTFVLAMGLFASQNPIHYSDKVLVRRSLGRAGSRTRPLSPVRSYDGGLDVEN